MMWQRASLFAAVFLLGAGPVAAQDTLPWNGRRAIELIERARVRRELPSGDSTLQNYQAKARGFVYFYLDRPRSEERTLVKVDQIALELFWRTPDRTKQRIVGLRDVNRLPNRMYYHLDHLTVVQNGFGDVIRIGDGDEVSDVLHPAAPRADSVYDYRLVDSLTLQLGGGQPSVRVYEIQVRPKRVDRSGLIGSVFVDRASADIVRMTFTFTPASYVDRRLDYINISLDNGLFGGRYWLPNEQSVEIRRQIPELDFAAGAVIRGHLRVSDYEFNLPLPDSVFLGRTVTAAPQAAREAYAFEEDIYAGLNTEGLAPPPQMADLRARAAQLVRQQRLSGLPRFRLYVPNVSSVLRHNRAEGTFVGLGAAYVPEPTFRVTGTAGYAFGAEHIGATAGVQLEPNTEARVAAGLYLNSPRDIGPHLAASGAFNTLASLLFEEDYSDPYYASGASLSINRLLSPNWRAELALSAERQRAAELTTSSEYRPVFVVDSGDAVSGLLHVERTLPDKDGWQYGADVSALGVHFMPEQIPFGNGDVTFARLTGDVNARFVSGGRATTLLVRLAGGAIAFAAPPRQYQFLIGGRGTLPGYEFRSFSGDSYGLGQLELSHVVWSPWLRLRGLAYAAVAGYSYDVVPLAGGTEGLRASAGVGVGLLWDVLRVDLVRGREWQVLFSIRPDLWDML